MLNPKTHFEQVPLKTVKKILENQAARENAAVQAQAARKAVSEEGLSAIQERARTSFHAISHGEA
jgi:hypothetical protein